MHAGGKGAEQSPFPRPFLGDFHQIQSIFRRSDDQSSRLVFNQAENARPFALKIHIDVEFYFRYQIGRVQKISNPQPSCKAQPVPRSTSRHREGGYRNREDRRHRTRPAQGGCLERTVDRGTERSTRYIEA